MQYIYLIRCQNFYKIGVANDVQSRLAQLSTGNPFPLELMAAFGFENANAVETVFHQKFACRWQRGEWFSLNPPELEIFTQICQMLDGKEEDIVTSKIDESELEEAEELATPIEGGKFDYAAMFADGWRMEKQDSRGLYWNWRKGFDGYDEHRRTIYGGVIKDLPYPIEEMRRIYRDGI
jgi:hypothetical protein